jgi:signal transduction histidine kinase
MNERVDVPPEVTSQTLRQAALRLGQGDDDSALFDAVLAGVARISGASQVSLLAVGDGPGEWRLLASLGDAGTGADPLPVALLEQALADGRVQFSDGAPGATREMVLPLRYGERPLGCIYAEAVPALLPQTLESALLALANLAAAALNQARLEASLAAAEQSRREFVSLTTHQLRVPLTSISGFTDLMLSGIVGSLSERQEQFMRTVQRNVGRMTLLIADLSDLNRIEDGRMPLDISAFELKALIEAVLQKEAQRIEARGHRLQRQLPDRLPAAAGDRAAVQRVFEKILDNAIRYTPDGGSLTVAAIHLGRRLQVTVADDGIGIGREDQARLFTPFFRSEAEAVREHTGWGLSLALARALLAAQGGELWVESEPGAGAVFHFSLPVA